MRKRCNTYVAKGEACGRLVEADARNDRTCNACQAQVDAAVSAWRIGKLLAAFLLTFGLMLPLHHASAQSQTCATPERMPTAEELGVIVLTNNYRQSLGLQPLAYDQTLTNAARWKAQQNAAIGSDEHNDSFRTWEQRFVDCGLPYGSLALGENLGAGQQTPAEIVGDWELSPHHNENLINPVFHFIGVAEADGVPPYRRYWVLEESQ